MGRVPTVGPGETQPAAVSEPVTQPMQQVCLHHHLLVLTAAGVRGLLLLQAGEGRVREAFAQCHTRKKRRWRRV